MDTTDPTASPQTFEPGLMAPERYDVAVVGGAFSGAATALLLLRKNPELRVLIVEREERFGRKVGEATVEISGYFVNEVLGLGEYLKAEHLPKHGLRFWFAPPEGGAKGAPSLKEMTEVGPSRPPALPSFQLDRSRLDEHLLHLAEEAGARVLRPARVRGVEMSDDGPATLDVETDDGVAHAFEARWVIDASGRHAFLGRRLRLRRRTEEHPTAALWGRWRGVPNLDVVATELGLPTLKARRRNATNHFCGRGWWCWMIPLAGGDTSVGLVYDKRMVDFEGDTPLERYYRFVTGRPGLGELLTKADLNEEDFHSYSHLPYTSDRYAGRGWALVGDAASFMDPYYSPGLDHAALSISATVALVADDLAGLLPGRSLDERLDEHNGAFTRSYQRWLGAIYLDRYEILGDARLTAAAVLIDTASYYLFVLSPILQNPQEELRWPPFGKPIIQTKIAARCITAYSRRLVRLARTRRRLGLYGRDNTGRRDLRVNFGPGRRSLPALFHGIRLLLGIELETLAARLNPFRRRATATPLPEPRTS